MAGLYYRSFIIYWRQNIIQILIDATYYEATHYAIGAIQSSYNIIPFEKMNNKKTNQT